VNLLHVEVVSPEAVQYSGEAEMVVCRTVGGGDIAFMAGHEPFLGALDIAQVRVLLEGGGTQVVAVHRGFVEVANDRVIVLSDIAELAEDVDRLRAERAKGAAESTLASDPDDEDAAEALARAELRLVVAA